MANANANANANTRDEIAQMAQKLAKYTDELLNAKTANYFFEIYAQTGAKTLILRKGAQVALTQMFDFEPLPRVSNKHIGAFNAYARACEMCEGCVRGADIIK